MKTTIFSPVALILLLIIMFLFHSIDGFSQIRPPKPAITETKNTCTLLKVDLKKQEISEGPCCYKVSLNNQLGPRDRLFPTAFEVSINNGNIINVFGTKNPWQQTPSTIPPKTKKVSWRQSTTIPGGPSELVTICVEGKAPVWLQYAWLDRSDKILCKDSIPLEGCINESTDLCDRPLIRNSGFVDIVRFDRSTAFWSAAYGNPIFDHTPGEGCFDDGFVAASGNQSSGDAISQTLDAQNKLRKGKKYVLNVSVRFLGRQNTLNYARIRAIAYNGTLPNNGSHPGPSSNIAIIDRSGKIRDCGDWSVIEFPVWTANKDFQNIAINVFTNDGQTASLWIDNVTLCETSSGYDCNEVKLDANNKPITPPGYGAVPDGFTCQPEKEEDEYDNGSLIDLYSQLYGYDGTTNWYANASDKCFSIGGTLPDEVLKYNCDDSLKMAGINMTCEELQKFLEDPDVDVLNYDRPPYLPPIGDFSQGPPCFPLPNDFGNMAFGGKDIIYIHGLELGHIGSRILNFPLEAATNWPDDPQEFYGSGYYKVKAEKTWDDHINYFATSKGYLNRYFVVSYNCSQRLEVAVHSVLTQIKEAMETGRNVKVPHPQDPRGTACFGRDYIIISQSTGAIIADVALSIAHSTKSNPNLVAKYGNIGLIADRCKGHIARRGAFAGSDLATLLVALANQPSPSATVLATAFVLQQNDPVIDVKANYPVIRQSILVDLIPKYTRARWGPYLDKVPFPVLTVTGGHPTFFSQNDLAFTNLAPLLGIPPSAAQSVALSMKYIVHPGYDDGVITMDCATGRKNSYLNQSFYRSTSLTKAFDMGIRKPRAITYYLDQRLSADPYKFASASSPYLSPTGMVQPVSFYTLNPSYNNHYSFIQAASEHWIKKNANCCDYNTTAIGGSANNEESLVVADASLLNQTTGIIDPGIISQMGETIKGEYVLFPYIKFRWAKGIYRPFVFWRKIYIWKRTYHKFRDDRLFDCDYVYKYLFRN